MGDCAQLSRGTVAAFAVAASVGASTMIPAHAELIPDEMLTADQHAVLCKLPSNLERAKALVKDGADDARLAELGCVNAKADVRVRRLSSPMADWKQPWQVMVLFPDGQSIVLWGTHDAFKQRSGRKLVP